METKVLLPADRMTTAQCVIECCGYLRTIANQKFEGEDWQTAPKLRRQNLLTDFLCNLELSGEEFAELCGLIGFQLSKTTAAKLAKFTVITYDWQSEANGEATADILATLDKCEGVTLIEERGYRPQSRTYDYLRFHIAAFWRCLVNELRSLCLGIGLVVRPKEIPATPTETPQISTETTKTVNVSAEGEKAAERAENKPYYTHRWKALHNCDLKTWDNFHKKHKEAILIFHHGTTYTALQKEAMKVSEMCDIAYKINRHGVEVCQFDDVTLDRIIEQGMYVAIAELPKAPDYGLTEPPQSPETPQMAECTAEHCKLAQTA